MTYSYPTWIINDMLEPLDDIMDVYGKDPNSPWDPEISKNFVYNGKCYACLLYTSSTCPKNANESFCSLHRAFLCFRVLFLHFYFTVPEKKFGYQPLQTAVSKSILNSSHILPEDQNTFLDMLGRLKRGDHYVEAEIQMCIRDRLCRRLLKRGKGMRPKRRFSF